ncbi:MAG: hypothetical protein RIT28_4879 [Pseudomonadota bacterium]
MTQEHATPPLTGAFAAELAAGRDRYNGLFLSARREHRRLDAEAVLAHVRHRLPPAVEAVAAVDPAAVPKVTTALYELSLELLGRELLGPQAQAPQLNLVFDLLLPEMPRLLAAAPAKLSTALINAVHKLSQERGFVLPLWVDRLIEAAPGCPDVPTLLALGQVFAWRGGLSHFREGALDVMRQLPADQVGVALGLRAGDPSPETCLTMLEGDPLWRPELARCPHTLRVVGKVGRFSGFGGEFRTPPSVMCVDGQLIAFDERACWSIHADAYGARLRRLGPNLPDGAESPAPPGRSVDREGRVFWGAHHKTFPELAERSGVACGAQLMAVTTPASHRIVLIALAPEPT